MNYFNFRTLNETFGIQSGDDWVDLGEIEHSDITFSPTNDLGGEDCFWNVATPEMIVERNAKIQETYLSWTPEMWMAKLDTYKSDQWQGIELDGKQFKSKNACARYCMEEYGVSRNTALRYLAEGRHPKDSKQKGREYGGTYRATKYL